MIQHTIVQPCSIFNAISIGSFGTSFDRYFTRRQMLAIFSTTAFLVRIHPMLAPTNPLTNCSRNYKDSFDAPSISETDRIVPVDENDVTDNPKIEFLTNIKRAKRNTMANQKEKRSLRTKEDGSWRHSRIYSFGFRTSIYKSFLYDNTEFLASPCLLS